MSNPLNTYSYKFYLNFVNSIGRFEITEPVKFDGASFIVEQDDKRYGRDVSFMNESIDLFFYNGVYDVADNPLMLPNGTVVNHLTQGFEYLIEERKTYGFEAEIEFILERNGVEFVVGVLDYQNAETDQYTYLSCKVIQNTSRQIIKRREDYAVDVFSDEDVEGNYIEPLTTVNILQKSKPVVQLSKWQGTGTAFYAFGVGSDDSYFYQNTYVNTIESGIDNTLNGSISQILPPDTIVADFDAKFYNFGYVDTLNDFTNVKMVIEDVTIDYFIPVGDDFEDDWVFGTSGAIAIIGNIYETGDLPNPTPVSTFTQQFYEPTNNPNPNNTVFSYEFLGTEPMPQNNFGISGNGDRYRITIPNIEITIPNVSRGHRIAWSWRTGRDTTVVKWNSTGNVSIQGTSTAIDTVIKGVRWIDLIKQNVKSISGLEVYAPQLDVGGQFYDNFAFTGNLIKGRDDVAFPVDFKTLMETIQEHNADYQILNDKVYISSYPNFYPNKEIGAFLSAPDDSAKSYFNERYTINEVYFNYKTFEQDKDSGNTIDAVHTETEWSLDNRQVENTKEISLPQIRDPFKIQFSIDEAVKDTTSTDEDDKLFLVDVVPLAPSTRGGFTATMTHNVNDNGQVQLLKDADLPSWAVLGFEVGSSFEITSDDNEGTYTVAEIEDSIITLTPDATQSFTGESLTTVEYPFTNVQYTNRTNEGFTLIENVLSPDRYSNLLYTPKRNLKHWESYIKTASKYKPNGSFRNRYFKSNGELTTQFTGETTPTVEAADIPNSELNEAILTPYIYETRLVVAYEDMVNALTLLETINEDDSIGGFFRCINNNGRVLKLYAKKLEYEPATETLLLTGEERDEGDTVTITSGTPITINEVGYDINTSYEWYESNNDYLVLFDNNNLPIINPTHYENVVIDGETFDSIELLLQKLIEIS